MLSKVYVGLSVFVVVFFIVVFFVVVFFVVVLRVLVKINWVFFVD